MKMDSIIFDVDGTLWNSTESVAKSWTGYLKNQEKIDLTLTSERLISLFGQTLPAIARQLFPDFSEAEQLRIMDGCCQAEHKALLKEPVPVYDGLEDALKGLYKKYPLFIVSNCQAGYIEVFLETTGLGHYFQGHLCPGDTGVAKAENIQKIAQMYHLSSPVYVGDTLGDFETCQKAGVPFIFASYGFGEVKHPWKSISQPTDLLDICL